MLVAENIIKAHRERAAAKDWAAWAAANPEKDKILTEAMLADGND